MNDVAAALRTALRFAVYSVLFAVGTTLLSTDPTAPAGAIPLLVAVALLVHATYHDSYRRIEVTLVGLYATLVVMLGTVTGVAVSSVSLPSFVTSDATLSVLLALVIVGVYVGQEASEGDTSASA